MKKLILIFFIISLSFQVFAIEKSRVRFTFGMNGSVTKFTENYNNSSTDYNNFDNYSTSPSNFKIYYVFENGFNLGWNQGVVTTKVPSECASDKISISVGGLTVGYIFGENFNFSIGGCVYCYTSPKDYKKNHIKYTIESTSDVANSFYMDFGFELSDSWELIIGANIYKGRSKSKIGTDANIYIHDVSFSTYDFGIGYKF